MTDLAASVAALATKVEQLEAANAELRAEVATLRAGLDLRPTLPVAPEAAAPEGTEAEADAPDDAHDRSLHRRRLLRTGLAAAGAAALGTVASSSPAAAANGDPVRIGNINTGSTITVLNPGLWVIPSDTSHANVMVGANGQTHLTLAPGDRGAPVADGFHHPRGDVIMDRDGALWICVTAGTPGTWRTLAGVGTTGPSAGALYPLDPPQRAYDSRAGTQPAQGPKTPMPGGSTTRRIRLNVPGVPGRTGGMTMALVNLLVVGAVAGSGNATIWHGGRPRPSVTSLVWGGSSGRASTLAVTGVDQFAYANIHTSIRADVVVDVLGYYA